MRVNRIDITIFGYNMGHIMVTVVMRKENYDRRKNKMVIQTFKRKGIRFLLCIIIGKINGYEVEVLGE